MSSAKATEIASLEAFSYSLPYELNQTVRGAKEKWERSGNTERLWNKDPSLWTNADEGHWLGWLDIVDQQLGNISKFKALTAEVHEDGFTHMLLLGMGGSSLCPEVFSKTFGRQPGSDQKLPRKN
jgi:transaldolase / glucose-6-phosphate isomerase